MCRLGAEKSGRHSVKMERYVWGWKSAKNGRRKISIGGIYRGMFVESFQVPPYSLIASTLSILSILSVKNPNLGHLPKI